MTTKRHRPRLRWTALPWLTAAPLLLVVISCRDSAGPSPAGPPESEPWFEDVTEESGIDHTYDNGQDVRAVTVDGKPLPDFSQRPMRRIGAPRSRTESERKEAEGWQFGHLSILETLGGGAGLLDYDGDGLLDV